MGWAGTTRTWAASAAWAAEAADAVWNAKGIDLIAFAEWAIGTQTVLDDKNTALQRLTLRTSGLESREARREPRDE